MQYNKEIDDIILIQLIILFALQKCEKPVNPPQLESLVLSNCNINFINYSTALNNLINTDNIRLFKDNDTPSYEITATGTRSIASLYGDIPVYIREPIEKSVQPMLRLDRIKKSTKAELKQLSPKEYSAELEIIDCDRPLMKMSFYAGTREDAVNIIKRFKENPEKLYQAVFNVLALEE